MVLNGKASDWSSVTSGVPQGSCLGPTLFLIYINTIDDCINTITGIISKFADDTKAGRVVADETDREELQREIDKLVEWTMKWQMEFNASKCKVVHFGKKNPGYTYTMGGFAPAGPRGSGGGEIRWGYGHKQPEAIYSMCKGSQESEPSSGSDGQGVTLQRQACLD